MDDIKELQEALNWLARMATIQGYYKSDTPRKAAAILAHIEDQNATITAVTFQRDKALERITELENTINTLQDGAQGNAGIVQHQQSRIKELEDQIGRLTEEHTPANPYEAVI